MAELNQAYTSILGDHLPEKADMHNIVGVLQGRVVNNTYYIYLDSEKNFYTTENNKKIKLQISVNDHGLDVNTPLFGCVYRVLFMKKN